MAVAAVDRDLEQSESEVERARERETAAQRRMTGLARWSGGAPARSPELRTGPMAVAAVDRDLEQSESERASENED